VSDLSCAGPKAGGNNVRCRHVRSLMRADSDPTYGLLGIENECRRAGDAVRIESDVVVHAVSPGDFPRLIEQDRERQLPLFDKTTRFQDAVDFLDGNRDERGARIHEGSPFRLQLSQVRPAIRSPRTSEENDGRHLAGEVRQSHGTALGGW